MAVVGEVDRVLDEAQVLDAHQPVERIPVQALVEPIADDTAHAPVFVVLEALRLDPIEGDPREPRARVVFVDLESSAARARGAVAVEVVGVRDGFKKRVHLVEVALRLHPACRVVVDLGVAPVLLVNAGRLPGRIALIGA